MKIKSHTGFTGFNRISGLVKIGLILSIFAFSGCASQPSAAPVAAKAAVFAQSPAGQALANTVITAALDGVAQYAVSGKIDRRSLVANSLDGAAENLRSLAGTSQATQPTLLYHAAADGIGVRAISQQVAPLVAANVTRQIDTGATPDQAIENLATALNTAAAKVR